MVTQHVVDADDVANADEVEEQHVVDADDADNVHVRLMLRSQMPPKLLALSIQTSLFPNYIIVTRRSGN